MSAEEEKDDVTPADAPEAKKPAAKKAAAKKPAKAAAKADAKADAKAGEGKAAEGKKPAAKKAAKKPAAAKEPVASEKKGRGKAAVKPPRRRIVRAHARYVRTSARKARMVCGHLRGKSVQEARAILAFTPREVARDWSKLLESAVANAESNHELVEDELIVREAYADEGPTIKRFRPRAMGRATPIRKRTSHLTIALTTDKTQRTTKRNG
jgi:ribosomal protein L22